MPDNEKNEQWEDPIVAEVRTARDIIARRFNYDINALCDHFVSKQKENEKLGMKYSTLRPKRRPIQTGTD